MKKSLLLITIIALGFFYKFWLWGNLPIPTDALSGMYHPWRDAIATDYPSGYPLKNFLISDAFRQQMIWRKMGLESLKKTILNPVDPSSFLGNDLAGNSQAGIYYPLNFLFLIFPFKVAWSLLIISQSWLLMVFGYLFFKSLKLSELASVGASIILGYCGFVVAWLYWGTMVSTFLWLPLILMSINTIYEASSIKKKLVYGGIIFLATIGLLTAGHPQVAFYCGLVISSAILIKLFTNKPNRWINGGIIASAGTMAILTLMPMISREWEAITNSTRASGNHWQEKGFFIPFNQLIQVLVPDYFGNPTTGNYFGVWNYGEMVSSVGVVGVVLAMVGLTTGKRLAIYSTIMVIAGLILATDNRLAHLPYWFNLPIWSSLQPTRLIGLIDLGLVILASLGLDSLKTKQQQKKWILMNAGVFLGLLVMMGLSLNNRVSLRNLTWPILINFASMGISVLVYKLEKLRKFGWLLLLGLIIIEGYRFGYKFLPFSDEITYFPQSRVVSFLQQQPLPFRIMSVDERVFPNNTLGWYGLESVGGYNPIYSKDYAEFIYAVENEVIPPCSNKFERIVMPKNFKSVLSKYLNLKYVVSYLPVEHQLLKPVYSELNTQVYEFNNYLNRFYLANKVEVLPSKLLVLNEMLADTSSKSAVFTTDNEISTSVPNVYTVKLLKYEANEQEIEVITDAESMLVNLTLNNSHWKAYIDNIPVQVIDVNYVFMAVKVPTGNHVVKFKYN